MRLVNASLTPGSKTATSRRTQGFTGYTTTPWLLTTSYFCYFLMANLIKYYFFICPLSHQVGLTYNEAICNPSMQ